MIIYQYRIYHQDLLNNPQLLYIFGDNEARIGMGGQAGQMRGEPNAFGIPTKKSPSICWHDADFEQNKLTIDLALTTLKTYIDSGRTIVFPSDGIGTGLARLYETAPLTFDYLTAKLLELGIKNGN